MANYLTANNLTANFLTEYEYLLSIFVLFLGTSDVFSDIQIMLLQILVTI